MNKLWLGVILAAMTGSSVAWAIHYQRYGRYEPQLHVLTYDGSVNSQNVVEHIKARRSDDLPKVELPDGGTHDFGVMAPGETGEHEFVIRNVGKGDLKLRLGATTCKCTIGSLDNSTLAPGEETKVKLEWDVKTNDKTFGQSAELLTNDPNHYAIQLRIDGRVIREMEMVPDAWSFGRVAAGEPIELTSVVYSYLENDIKPTVSKFSSDSITDMAEFDIQPYQPTEEVDGPRSEARQAFKVKVTLKAGLRQGPLQQNFMFGFRELDESGEFLPAEVEDTDDPNKYLLIETAGRIVGALSMIEGTKLTSTENGEFIYDWGRLGDEDVLTAKTFVVLKGSERENTKLSLGEMAPDGVVKATLGDPVGRGSMTLYPLELELVPGKEMVERLGRHKSDYGWVWIESDNPKVPKMRLALKFAVSPRP